MVWPDGVSTGCREEFEFAAEVPGPRQEFLPFPVTKPDTQTLLPIYASIKQHRIL